MNADLCAGFPNVPLNPGAATKHVMELLLHSICPKLQKLQSKLKCFCDFECEDEIVKIKNVFMLCSSQIKKCMVNFLDIIKMENKKGVNLQESRQFIFERLSWCIAKLSAVDENLDKCKLKDNIKQDLSDDPIFATPMYFVNWIDYTFEILAKLAEDVYRTDYKTNNALYEEWKMGMVEHVSSLHMSIDELLLSAMTLCKYCLPEDQTVLRARSQVVLRETKSLFGELINGDISAAVKITKENLKLPIMPSNVNMMIDVLKDVLYVLETNTNTALLALLIHCYVNCASPVDILQDHFLQRKQHFCQCSFTSLTDVDIDTCKVIKEFDLYNERLQQIGSFAVSCSSDQKRILSLRSCLSSLESLDPHLVPEVSTSPDGHHTKLLANFWKQEVLEIRDTVFLIVDPIAFVEKCKQYMHDMLLEMRQNDAYDSQQLWVVMGVGCMVHDFFSTYRDLEPDAIAHHDELDHLLEDLNRAQKECKKVSEYFAKDGTFLFDTKMKCYRNEINYDSFIVRVKLLYSMVKKVYELIRPKDNDEQLFGEEEIVVNRNQTHTIHNDINTDTYVNGQKKAESNFTRSIFARTGVKSSTQKLFLSKLTKHLQLKKGVQSELNFSAQVSELFNLQEEKEKSGEEHEEVKTVGDFSLRKAIFFKREFPFMRKLDKTFDLQLGDENKRHDESNHRGRQEGISDETASLQISAILNQINDITSTYASREIHNNASKNLTRGNSTNEELEDSASMSNISNATQPSSFTTLERISDLDFVESKLNSLRATSEFETHL